MASCCLLPRSLQPIHKSAATGRRSGCLTAGSCSSVGRYEPWQVPEMDNRLRVAILAGSLGQGGAEKQLVYIVRSLIAFGANVRVYSLTHGDFHEEALAELGTRPIWVGRPSGPARRLAGLTRQLLRFKPDFIH